MSPANQGVFELVEEVTSSASFHFLESSICACEYSFCSSFIIRIVAPPSDRSERPFAPAGNKHNRSLQSTLTRP